MSTELQFEWDDDKAAANFEKHGIGFPAATRILVDPRMLNIEVSRPEEREKRWKATGSIDGRLFIVVYTMRGGVYRLISARRANKKEERLWLASH